MSITRFYKIVTPRSKDATSWDSSDIISSTGIHGRYSWYNRLVHGSASRRHRYGEYDLMDRDPDISLALDMIAEEMVGNISKGEQPLLLKLDDDQTNQLSNATIHTLGAALKTFIKMHSFDTPRLYNICRTMIKYGDVFYVRPKHPNGKLTYVHPQDVECAITPEYDISDIKGWIIRGDAARSYSGMGSTVNSDWRAMQNSEHTRPFKKEQVINFSLWDECSEEAPFGKSILTSIYKAFKQKELLEDAIVIYRIQRAPERRVFYIDVGRIHPAQVQAVLNKAKNDFRQKKIPSTNAGHSQVDSIYNPQSMQEDFFMAVRPNSQGGRIETLPGGQNLGNLDDLHIFFRKIWRGLKIPESYINHMAGDGGMGQFNDGRVGIALMQEIKFILYIERLQTYVESVLDAEFKKFLYDNGLQISPTAFSIILPPPSNYQEMRKLDIDSAQINAYTSMHDVRGISKRFAQERYLGLSMEEIARNERLYREELGLDPDGGKADLPKIYNPEDAEAGGFEGGLGGGGGFSGFGGGPPPSPPSGDDVGGDSGIGSDSPPETTGDSSPPTGDDSPPTGTGTDTPSRTPDSGGGGAPEP